jgi:hypothetical protein
VLGCGSSDSHDPVGRIDFGNRTLAKCLKDGGASFATEPADISFFDESSSSKFATYFDRAAKLIVQIWQDGEDPREWLLWQAEQFDERNTVMDIVESPTGKDYIAYVVKPSHAQRLTLENCTE